jgi:hypothetical protein
VYEPVYVPFEPGLNVAQTLPALPLMARRVERVPDVAAVRTDQADHWFETPALSNLLNLRDHQPADPVTRVAILRDDRFLFIAFDCIEPDVRRVRRFIPRDAPNGSFKVYDDSIPRVLDQDDHVAVGLDAGHDHATVLWLRTNLNSARRATRATSTMSWAAVPVSTRETDPADVNWDSDVVERGDRWRAAFRVELSAVGVDPIAQPTVGLHLGRAHYGVVLRHFGCTATLPELGANPLAFADLYLNAPDVTVRSVAWADRAYGPNRLIVAVAGHGNPRQVRAFATLSHATGLAHTSESAAAAVTRGGTAELALAYHMPHNYEGAKLAVELRDAISGEILYRGTFPVGNHANLNTPTRRPDDARDPRPDDEDFYEKKRNYVLSRLPRFGRKTTAQGAPSDFTLASTDGQVTFSLMEAGAVARIGRWLDSLFDNAIDRVVAAALFSNQDWVTTHCNARVGMHTQLTALSCLRLGSGHCYSRAVAGAGIVGSMTDPNTGKPFEAYPVLVLGHVVVAVRWRDAWTFIDPSFGHFFFNRANTDLATDAELEADHELIKRVGLSKSRLRNYGRRDVHVRLEEGTIVWPAGAPPR